MVRFSLPLIPFSDADTWGYLHPAITLFTRGDFVHTYARSFVYPLCIHVVLRIFGDYAALSVVQHLSGLGAALILLVTWNRIPHFVNLPSPFPEAHRWLGLVPFGMYLFSATTIELEHTIRPEAIFPFVAENRY